MPVQMKQHGHFPAWRENVPEKSLGNLEWLKGGKQLCYMMFEYNILGHISIDIGW